jgi:hypothetical protein
MPATTAFIIVGVDHLNDGTITPYDYIDFCEDSYFSFKMRSLNEQDLVYSGLDFQNQKELIPSLDNIIDDLMLMISVYSLGLQVNGMTDHLFFDIKNISIDERDALYQRSMEITKKSKIKVVISIINSNSSLTEERINRLTNYGIDYNVLK